MNKKSKAPSLSGLDIDFDKSLEYQYEFIEEIIDKVGPRLPGSKEEKKAANLIKEKFTKLTGVEAKSEEFRFAPKASIGLIPALGYFLLLVLMPLYYINTLAHLIVTITTLFFAVCQIFRYTGWFDFLFPKKSAHNVYSVLEPPSGKVQYTLVLSGHIDSSWHSPLFAKKPELSQYKIMYGIASAFFFIIVSLLKLLYENNIIVGSGNWTLYIPILFIPGHYFLSRYLVWTKEKASPGAMDDLAGIAMSMWLVKYWLENPDKRPKNCRIVLLAIGSEEAGLKGSFAFVEKHKKDLLSEENNPWVVILDGIGDKDYCHVVVGDEWLTTNYNETLRDLADEAMNELGIKHDLMKNPAGGTDSAAYARNKIRTICLAAQDPTPGFNYHTCYDTLENIEKKATKWITASTVRLIEKLDELEND